MESSRALNRLRKLATILFRRNLSHQAQQLGYPRSLRYDSTRAIMEQLEPRVMLSATYTVDTLQDIVDDTDGLMSLREAIIAANANEGADTINFSVEGEILLSEALGELEITDDLTITGLDPVTSLPHDITIDAAGNSRIFNIAGAAEAAEGEIQPVLTVNIDNLTLTGGQADNGGAIYADGATALSISESIIKQNAATEHGGGIYIEGESSNLDIDKTQILGNTAGGYGGGLYTSAQGSMTTSTVVGNVSDSMGGGVVCYKDATFEMDSCTITCNEARKYYGGIFVYAGFKKAAYSSILEMFNLPTKTYPVEAKAAITNSIVSLNKAAHNGNMYKKGLTKTNLISTDPLFFANPDKGADGVWGTEDDYYGNLRLQFKSKGLNKSTATEGTDIAGNPRVFGTAADYGAYETDQLLVNDTNLLAAINNHLGQAADMPVTIKQVEEMTGDFDASNYGITDLTGLQAAINLDSIDLSYNPITTLTPLLGNEDFNVPTLNLSYTSLTQQARAEGGEVSQLEARGIDVDTTGYMGAAYGRNKFTFYDTADDNGDDAADNDKVTVKLSGNGMCMVIFEDGYEFNDDGDIVGTPAKINLIDTDKKSKLSISVKANKETGDGTVTLHELNSENILKSISGKAVNFNGQINLNTAGDETSAETTKQHGVAITLGEIEDTAIDANDLGISKLTIYNWDDTDETADSIAAAWIGKIDVKGRKDNSRTEADEYLAGNFEADIDISDAHKRDISLKYLNVKGTLDGSTITTSEDGSVYKVTAGEISDTTITTHHMNTIQTKGLNGDDNVNGDLTAALIFTGVSTGGYEIRQIKAANQLSVNVTQADVEEGEEIAAGLIHKIEADTIANSDVTASRIKMISAKADIENSNFDLEDADSSGYSLGTLKAKGKIDGLNIEADGAVKSISATGDILNSTFTLEDVDRSDYSLPSVKTKGSIGGVTIDAVGGIKKIQADGDALFDEIDAAWITYLEAKGKVDGTAGDVQIDSLNLDGENSKGHSIVEIIAAGNLRGGNADEGKTWTVEGSIDELTADGNECSIVEATINDDVNTIKFGGVKGFDMTVHGHFGLFDVAGNFDGKATDDAEQGQLKVTGILTKFQVDQKCSNVDILASGQASEIERFYVGALENSSVYSENLLHSVKVLGWGDDPNATFLSNSTFEADAFTGITLTNWEMLPQEEEGPLEAAGPFILIEDEANIGYLKYNGTGVGGDDSFTWKPTQDWALKTDIAKASVIGAPQED